QSEYLLKPKRILVVEDSVGSGATAQREFKKLHARPLATTVPHEFFFLAVYGVQKNVPAFNLILEVCPGPRMFEWNWLNNARLGRAILDIDGVLCKDPPVIEDHNPGGYQKYLLNAVPLFVPKIPSARITDLATAIDPDLPHKVIGIRPGEKLHEVMCPLDDSHLTLEFDDHYVIKPSIQFGFTVDFATNALGEPGRQVQSGFEYNSGTNPHFLTVEEIGELTELAGV
ncbi:MAG: polysaccharide biosynthesis protein, partial [Gemmatimonadetes bacterium]|nr:polysaccharide biosynthesis protein [Gemmatimonadota bacterium]